MIDRSSIKLRTEYLALNHGLKICVGIEKKLRVMAIDIYGLDEVIGPGVATSVNIRQACISMKIISFLR
jgi:hypothetical protein